MIRAYIALHRKKGMAGKTEEKPFIGNLGNIVKLIPDFVQVSNSVKKYFYYA
jgi:hypothetical protein